MAVVTLKKRQAQAIRIGQREPQQICIAHCSISKKVLNDIKKTIRRANVKPFFAQEGTSSTIVNGIENSEALFVILTKNSLIRKSVRDWIMFEIGLAEGLWNQSLRSIRQQKIFVWKDETVKLSKDSPIHILDKYRSLRMHSKRSKEAMLKDMNTIAQNISSGLGR